MNSAARMAPGLRDMALPEATPQTLPHFCLGAYKKFAKADAMSHKRADQWTNISGEEIVHRVRALALALFEIGVRPGDRVAVMSENRPEWSITDLAILSLRAVNVPIYTTQAVEQISLILKDSESRVLCISGARLLKHALPALNGLDALERVITFDRIAAAECDRELLCLEDLEARGKHLEVIDPRGFDALLSEIRPDDLATVLYTSGTTGVPKGVMLSHANFVSNIVAIAEGLPISTTDVALSVLPLSHIFERTCFYVFCCTGVSVYYSSSFDQLGEHLQEVHPTIMTAVPRLFEKVYHKIIKKGMAETGFKRRIFLQALAVGQRHAELQLNRRRIPMHVALGHAIADRLVFSKWRAGVGGKMRYFVSGGAPLSAALSYAFWSAGIPILQGFGMTETCVVSANRPEDNRIGSVGTPFPGIEIKIAPDGEILVKGPNVMQGYYRHDDDTAAVMHEDWFQTGDVGYLDQDGYLFITDRKKDLFKLSNGKYVAPQQIESLIKQSGLINQVVVVGAHRKTPVALIVPDWESLKLELKQSGSSIPPTRADLSSDPAAVRLVQRAVTVLTKDLADYERVRKIVLLPDELSIENGELTPTLKVKRRVVEDKYAALIEGMYA